MQCLALIYCVVLLVACGGPNGKARGYDKPSVNEVVQQLVSRSNKAVSFMAESRMEYWANGQRIKPTVLVMGKRGAKVRFNALSPTGGNVAADLACNGANFQFVDFDRNCQLSGPCSKESIGQLLGVSLNPDDFLLLAVGATPMIDSPTGTVKWDSRRRLEIVRLTSQDGLWKQEIILDGRSQSWDILSSTVWNVDGKVEWKLTNRNFSDVTSEDQQSFRVPLRTRFEQPQAKSEVAIRWIEREINSELSEDKFVMQVPNLPRCR